MIMRVDSCKKCGNSLEISQYCDVCKQPVSFICNGCKREEDQFHLKCTLSSFSNALLKALQPKSC